MKAFDVMFIGAVVALVACFIPLWLGHDKSTVANLLKAIGVIVVLLVLLIIMKFHFGYESDIFGFGQYKPIEESGQTEATIQDKSEEPESGQTEELKQDEIENPEDGTTEPIDSSNGSTEQIESKESNEAINNELEIPSVSITRIEQFNIDSNEVDSVPDYVKENFGYGITKGFYGTYKYSRDLTEAEKESWRFGGELYDINQNVVENDGTSPVFHADPDGHFAVGLAKNIEPGSYTYKLILYIGIKEITDYIKITID